MDAFAIAPERIAQSLAWAGPEGPLQSTLAAIAASRHWRFQAFPSVESFLQQPGGAALDRIGCLTAMLEGPSAGELIERVRRDPAFPRTVLVALNTPPETIVEASRAGAAALLDAGCQEQELVQAVDKAMHDSQQLAQRRALRQSLASRAALLDRSDALVLRGLLDQKTALQIAQELGLSARTIESRQARILKTLSVRSLAELVAMMSAAGLMADLGKENLANDLTNGDLGKDRAAASE